MNRTKPDLRILVRGANDVGSAVAHRLYTTGYSVVIHETPQPATTRRRMSFTDAVFDGQAVLDGMEAQLIKRLYLLRGALVAHQVIPVVVKDFHELMQTLHPQILVDARMRKHIRPESQRGLAEFTLDWVPTSSQVKQWKSPSKPIGVTTCQKQANIIPTVENCDSRLLKNRNSQPSAV